MDLEDGKYRENINISCRLCLCLNSEMLPLFPSELVKQLLDCTGIEMYPDDRLPSKICTQCAKQLSDYHIFFNKCHRTHNYLNSMINELSIKHETISVSDYDPLVSDNETHVSSKKAVEIPNQITTVKTEKISEATEKSRLKKKSLKIKRTIYDVKKKIKRSDRKDIVKCINRGLLIKNQPTVNVHSGNGEEKSFICAICDRNFLSKSSLKLHITRTHMNKKQKADQSQTCENCGKTLSNAKNLKIHMRIHTGEMPYECSVCFKRFTQIGTLISHRRVHTGEKPFVCKLCGRAFAEHTHLRRHQSVHSEEKPFICNICGKGLKSHYALTQHTKLHTNEKEHVCDQCGLSFMVKGNLDHHKRMKHSEKSGQCDICNKIFPNLKDHMVVHTGEKPFECSLCDKKFSVKRGLTIHSRQHTHAGRYKCNLEGCNRSFSARWVFDCHVKKHTGHMPYMCKYCTKSYPRICHLTQHLKLIHPNEDRNNIQVVDN